MRYKSTQQTYTTGRLTLPAVYVIAILGWTIALALSHDQFTGLAIEHPIWSLLPLNNLPLWASTSLAFITFALIGYLIIQLNNQFTIIKRRATIQTSLLFLFVTAILPLHLFQPTHIAALAFVSHSFFLFQCHKESQTQTQQFYAAFFTALLFICIPKTIFIIPVILITKLSFNSLNIKTILASLLGFSLPIWLLFGHAYWHDQMELFYYPFAELSNWTTLFNYKDISLIELLTFGFILFTTGLSTIYLLYNRNKAKIRTRQILNHFLRIDFVLILLIAIDPTLLYELAPIVLIAISFVYGHALMLNQNKLSNWLFICSIILLLTIYITNLWKL